MNILGYFLLTVGMVSLVRSVVRGLHKEFNGTVVDRNDWIWLWIGSVVTVVGLAILTIIK